MLLCSLPWHLGAVFFLAQKKVECQECPLDLRDFSAWGNAFWQVEVPDVVCVTSNAFGRSHMKARVLEIVGCQLHISWKSVLTLSFLAAFGQHDRMVPLGGTWSLSKKEREKARDVD